MLRICLAQIREELPDDSVNTPARRQGDASVLVCSARVSGAPKCSQVGEPKYSLRVVPAFWVPPELWKVCPGGLPLRCRTMDEHFHKKMMIRIRFFNPKWGEPKYSIRVVPERTEVLNRGGTHV